LHPFLPFLYVLGPQPPSTPFLLRLSLRGSGPCLLLPAFWLGPLPLCAGVPPLPISFFLRPAFSTPGLVFLAFLFQCAPSQQLPFGFSLLLSVGQESIERELLLSARQPEPLAVWPTASPSLWSAIRVFLSSFSPLPIGVSASTLLLLELLPRLSYVSLPESSSPVIHALS
jgi:hypothetical protein